VASAAEGAPEPSREPGRKARRLSPSPAIDEQQLVERAKAGDHGAYAELVRPHEGLALRMSYLITRDVHEAEDAVQEALVKTYFALRRFKRGAPFRPWLLRIVINEAKDRRRSADRRLRLLPRLARADAAAPASDAAVLDLERTQDVLAALAALRDEERLVVACRAILGLSEEETAAALGTPLGTAKSRYARGRALLRRHLEGSDA
jgi:RNA polymerase sigma factor (sigma-70 family)